MTVQQRGKSAGFSLIEILLVIALVAVLAGIVAGNASAFILGGNSEPPDRVLKRAVLDALYFSTEKKEEVRLSWSRQQATFLIKDRNGGILKKQSIYEKLDEESMIDEELQPRISFFAIPPKVGFGGSSSPLNDEDLFLTEIIFNGGYTFSFLAEIEFRGKNEILEFDPFSGFVLQRKT